MSEDSTARIRQRLDYTRELVVKLSDGVYSLCVELANSLPEHATPSEFVETAEKLLDQIAQDLDPNSEYIDTDAGDLVAKARREWNDSFPRIVNTVCPQRYAHLVLAYHSALRRK